MDEVLHPHGRILNVRPKQHLLRGLAVGLALALQPTTPAAAQSGPDNSRLFGAVPSGATTDILTDLDIPWSMVAAGDDMLVSQRDLGTILAFRPGQPARVAGTVPGVVARIDGGLLGLAVLEEGGTLWVYAFHCSDRTNRIVRMPYVDGTLGEAEVILDGLPGGRAHNGGRIAFGPDGMLYATTGDANRAELAQDPTSYGGKILRMTPTGAVPDDNPFPGSLIWSLGHRHPQGLAWDAEGQLWSTEFGDDAWDELNRIVPGGNYGWPVHEGIGNDPVYVDPVVQWPTQEMGPSGLTFMAGTLFIAGLTGQRLWAVAFDAAGGPVTQSFHVNAFGRLRDVRPGPDGTLWILTNRTDGRGDPPQAGDDRIVSLPVIAPGD